MAFDPAEYRKRVLTQYKGERLNVLSAALRELRASPDRGTPSDLDLVELYQIEPGIADSAIAQQVSAVADVLTKCVTNAAFKSIGPSLVELHKLLVARNPQMRTRTFWDEISRVQREQDYQELAEFGEGVAAEFRTLGVITPGLLRKLARAAGIPDSIRDAELRESVMSHGISLKADWVLPDAVVPPALTGELRKSSCRSVLSAVFLEKEPTGFQIIDGFVSPDPGQRLSLAALSSARSETDRRAQSNDNDSIKKVLGVLQGVAPTDAALHQLVLTYFVDVARSVIAIQPLPGLALRDLADRTGLADVEAARILLQVRDGVREAGFPDVLRRIEAGELKDARRLYESLAARADGVDQTERASAETALEAVERRLGQFRANAMKAVEAGDVAAAAEALRQALTICADDETLDAMARSLPPAAPLRLTVTTVQNGRLARVAWEPGFGTTDGVTYQVIRKLGQEPQNNTDGEVIAQGLEKTWFEDPGTTPAVLSYYGVAASRGAGLSPVTTAAIKVLPPVSGVLVTSDPSSVTLRWDTPSGARAVTVKQTAADGTTVEVPVGTQSGARSQGLRTGQTYSFSIVALYTAPDGSTQAAEPVRVTAIPRGVAEAVSEFQLTDGEDAYGDAELTATWAPINGFTVELWHYARRPEWEFGSRLPMKAIREHGTRLAGRGIVSSHREGVSGSPGYGIRYYVGVTRDGDNGVIGAVAAHGIGPKLENVRLERFGDLAVLAWDWPGRDLDVLVRWSGPDGESRRVVTLNSYRRDGGCRIPVGTSGAEVQLSTLAEANGVSWSSPTATLSIAPAPAPVTYTVEFRGRSLGRGPTAVLTFLTGRHTGRVDILVVGRADRVMPRSPDQGTTLTAASLDFEEALKTKVEVALPRVTGPYWVRAFPVSPGWRLVDPPAAQLKGQ